MCAVCALSSHLSLFQTFLRIAVEGECGDGAVEMWGSKAPGAVGTAPAGEVISFAPDRTFVHTSTFCVRLGFKLGRGEGNTSMYRARKVNSCPPECIFHRIAIRQSN